MQEVLLTITMLVSDREETIEKCLASLSHLREAIPCELIVVDTAGNEKCMEVVRKYTDKIVHFTWCDDFAAARNAGLKEAKGQWIMFLDDDEWFENTDSIEDFFVSGKYQKFNSAIYYVRNYMDAEGSGWMDSMAVRMVKRQKNTRFVGKIHENLQPFENPRYYCRDYVHHYGYVYESEQKKMEHIWRNISALVECRKETPDNFQILGQLVNEYMRSGNFFAALEVIREMKKKAGALQGSNGSFTSYAVAKEVEIFHRQKRLEEAYRIGVETLKEERILLFAYGSIVNLMIKICYGLEKYEEALLYINKFKKILKQWNSDEAYDKQDFFRLSLNYLTKDEEDRIQLMEFHMYVLQKKWKTAKELMLRIDWNNPKLDLFFDSVKDVVWTIAQAPYEEQCHKIFCQNLRREIQKKILWEILENMPEEEKRNVLSYIYRFPSNSIEVCMCQIHYAVKIQDLVRIYKILEELKTKGLPMLLNVPQFWKDLFSCGIPMGIHTKEVSSVEWMKSVEFLMKEFSKEDREILYQVLCNGIDKKSFRFYYLTALWMESRMLEKEPKDISWEELYSVSLYWMACGGMLYKDEVFLGENLEVIPEKYQFAWFLMQANAVKENTHLFVQKIAQAAKAYPLMKEYCKEIMKKKAEEV